MTESIKLLITLSLLQSVLCVSALVIDCFNNGVPPTHRIIAWIAVVEVNCVCETTIYYNMLLTWVIS